MASLLVIDDDKNMLDVLKTSLELAGHNVCIAANGKDAFKSGYYNNFDIVITDIYMPEQDGFELILKLREVAPKTKIIAISGGGFFQPQNALNIAKHLGADIGMNKPFQLKDLLDEIDKLVRETPVR